MGKGKELSTDARGLIIELHKSGLGYKKISEATKMPKSTVTSVVLRWK